MATLHCSSNNPGLWAASSDGTSVPSAEGLLPQGCRHSNDAPNGVASMSSWWPSVLLPSPEEVCWQWRFGGGGGGWRGWSSDSMPDLPPSFCLPHHHHPRLLLNYASFVAAVLPRRPQDHQGAYTQIREKICSLTSHRTSDPHNSKQCVPPWHGCMFQHGERGFLGRQFHQNSMTGCIVFFI